MIVKMAERGIACNVHYKLLAMMTAYKILGFESRIILKGDLEFDFVECQRDSA